MNDNDPNIHHRRSIRIKDYDYSTPGYYFITLCCNDKTFLLSDIINDTIILNEAGKLIEKWCHKITNKFPKVKIPIYVIMPNHLHFLIDMIDVNNYKQTVNSHTLKEFSIGKKLDIHHFNLIDQRADTRVCPYDRLIHLKPVKNKTEFYINKQINIFNIIQWFKTMTTNNYIHEVKNKKLKHFNKRLWQRNYYEHIVRNGDDYNNIYNYILLNPVNWNKDELFVK
jgi:REP element-mobilizing transposase RayT